MNGSAVHLRAPAELPALQLTDQQPQLLDLGSRCIMPGAKGVPLGQNSVALDLESSVPGALAGDDFRHLLQLS
jgi:hypothetical protein